MSSHPLPPLPPSTPPIACDMTHARDTPTERLADYERLFTSALAARERTEAGIRFRFRALPGLEMQVRDLAAREKGCCAFFTFTVARRDDEVWWDAGVVDDDIARQVLEEFYDLPVTLGEGPSDLYDRFSERGLQVVIDDAGRLRPVTRGEIVAQG